MKKIFLISIIGVLTFLQGYGIQNPMFIVDNCLYLSGTNSYYGKMTVNSSACANNEIFSCWLEVNGSYIGPLNYTLTNGSLKFDIPSSLNSLIQDGECINFSYDWGCGSSNVSNPFLLDLQVWKLCFCSPLKPCVAHFNYESKTRVSSTGFTFFEFNDDYYGYLMPTINSYINNIDCIQPINHCIASVDKKIKVTDEWTFYDGNFVFYQVNVNNIQNPSLYNNLELSMNPFNLLTDKQYFRVCHRKLIECICTTNYTNCDLYTIPLVTKLYDCNVCQDICVSEVSTSITANLDEFESTPGELKMTKTQDVEIFPNPEYNELKFASVNKLIKLELLSSEDKQIEEFDLANQNSVIINISDLKQGIYSLKYMTTNGNGIKHFIVLNR